MKKTIRDYDLFDKRVIIRCDFNVPKKGNRILDDTRIKESIETIRYAIDNNAKVILMSHLGRIRTDLDKKNNSLLIVSKRLEELLNKKIIFEKSTRSEQLTTLVNNLKRQEVLLIENTRFEDIDNKKESNNDKKLSLYWASLGDIFINNAFGTSHREHASNVGIASIIPSGIGFLIEKELDKLNILNNPEKNYTVILGGAKVNDKIRLIENILPKIDNLIVGGAMAFTFLKAKGYNLGKSLIDEDNIEFCKSILKKYSHKITLPIDLIVTKEFSNDVNYINKDIKDLEDSDMGMDIGINTVELFKSILKDTKTLFFNGPLGVCEMSNFQMGTKAILEYITENNIKTVLGGGNIVAASSNLGYNDKIYHISTGGGATLELLEKGELPGINIITDK